ncbi:uncharacterized protein LOC112589852 [Harpegnathos saltator]|uniref:uncharacterized protein LOC112589852 n=1 Tax=Harpegnathos saltator TaxID=610380 RepID=UPI000DBEDE9F|nr:uncharacterized protein LOC112589852 [Harpegnathos saltator]
MPVTFVNKTDSNKEIDIVQDIAIIKEQCASICRMHASLLLTLKNINEILHIMERKPGTSDGIRYQFLDPLLPLKNLQNIVTLEELITSNDSALSQYKNFIANIGGHTPRDNIQRILRKVFSDECTKLCSWKGKKTIMLFMTYE